jgi:NADPH-dependent glutamate synthase beta subunit-like oxidoreductase
MNLKKSDQHFVAVFGGAVAGSEAAFLLSQNGFRVAVFDQALLPYGKIEDGLPKWHSKLRDKEERNIDRKLDHPNISFVPGIRLGRDLEIREMLDQGFSAIIIATGAWKDRALPIDGIERFENKNLIYQNPFVYWFNHKHEPGYSGPEFVIQDNTLVIGGGLASLDVVKIIMIETVQQALLDKMGIKIDLFTLERGIDRVFEKYSLNLQDLGLAGCTLVYRRRAIDMPLSPLPTDTEEKLLKAQLIRKKILDNFQKKYLFNFLDCYQPTRWIGQNNNLEGIRFQKTKVENGKLTPTDEFINIESKMIISSIGSIPEKITGIPYAGSVFKISDPKKCLIEGFDNVFAIGNAVTGRGNINESVKHGRDITEDIVNNYLNRQKEEYEAWHRNTTKKVDKDISNIMEVIKTKDSVPQKTAHKIHRKITELQLKSGYNGSYADWVKRNTPPRLENL